MWSVKKKLEKKEKKCIVRLNAIYKKRRGMIYEVANGATCQLYFEQGNCAQSDSAVEQEKEARNSESEQDDYMWKHLLQVNWSANGEKTNVQAKVWCEWKRWILQVEENKDNQQINNRKNKRDNKNQQQTTKMALSDWNWSNPIRN